MNEITDLFKNVARQIDALSDQINLVMSDESQSDAAKNYIHYLKGKRAGLRYVQDLGNDMRLYDSGRVYELVEW